MKTRHIMMAALLATATAAQAQFVAEMNDGTHENIPGTTDAAFKKGTDGSWTFGGKNISNISRITTMPLDERLNNYKAPTYSDYYRNISGWDKRRQWNLANVHDPSVMRAEDGYYYMYTTDASFGNAHTGHGHFMCRRSRNLVAVSYTHLRAHET